jgi:hypothetical protein
LSRVRRSKAIRKAGARQHPRVYHENIRVLFGSWLSVAYLFGQPALRITAPADRTVVRPGQTITVTVAPSGGTFSQVTVLVTDPIKVSPEVRAAPPYEFTLAIPLNIQARAYAVTALGVIAPGQGAKSEPIDIVVDRSEAPVSVRVEPSVLELWV